MAEPQTTTATYFGGRGVGKSTLHGSMWAQGVLNPAAELLITLGDIDASRIPRRNVVALQRACDRPGRVVGRIPRDPNPGTDRYQLDVYFRGARRLQLDFLDTAGAETESGAVIEPLGASAIGILAIDAVSLLQPEAIPADVDAAVLRNLPLQTIQLIQQWVTASPETPRLLCIAVLRIESFIYDANGAPNEAGYYRLAAALRETYAGLFNQLKLSPQTAVVILPVQIVGCLRLETMRREEDQEATDFPAETWAKIPDPSQGGQAFRRYAPADCDQVLRYILRFLLAQLARLERANREREGRAQIGPLAAWAVRMFGAIVGEVIGAERAGAIAARVSERVVGWWGRVYRVFTEDPAFAAAARRYALQTRDDDVCKIVQGRHVLTLE